MTNSANWIANFLCVLNDINCSTRYSALIELRALIFINAELGHGDHQTVAAFGRKTQCCQSWSPGAHFGSVTFSVSISWYNICRYLEK